MYKLSLWLFPPPQPPLLPGSDHVVCKGVSSCHASCQGGSAGGGGSAASGGSGGAVQLLLLLVVWDRGQNSE